MKITVVIIVAIFIVIQFLVLPIVTVDYKDYSNDPLYRMMKYDEFRINCRIQKGWQTYTLDDIIFCDNLALKYYL